MNIKKINKLTIIILISIVLTSCNIDNNLDKEITEKSIENTKEKQEKLEKNINLYEIDAEIDTEKKLIIAKQSTTYVNNENTAMDKIYLHLYPNAFKTKETAPFLFDDFRRAYRRGFEEGSIEIEKIYIKKEKANYKIKGLGDSILEINLENPLEIGEKAIIEMDYVIKIPPATERFGYGNETYNMGNWYPVLAVYDETGWNLDPYYPIGDPFYTDISNYKVTIRAPKEVVIAATGKNISQKILDNKKEWKFEANRTRDFAWVASKEFEVIEKLVDNTLVKMYFIKNTVNEHMKNKAIKYTEQSLNTFNDIFGEYPYKEYSIVQTNFPSGMEYPGIVFIGKQYYIDQFNKDFLETLIVHETAHQWWYGVVGNDQIDEAWLDESLASYSEVIYFTENYGDKAGERYHTIQNEEIYYQVLDSLGEKQVLMSLDEFTSWEDYSLLVYNKGAMLLNDIKEKYGEEVLYNILNRYYDKYKFEIAKTEDFLKVCEEVTGDELGDYFEDWLN